MSNPQLAPKRLLVLAAAASALLVLSACSGNRAEINATCEEIHSEISGVDLAAESVYQDMVEDGLEVQEQQYDQLDLHFENVEYLESIASGDVQDAATERADAAGLLLDGVDAGDDNDITEGADQMVETHDMILDACD